jgi:hypothetical protein
MPVNLQEHISPATNSVFVILHGLHLLNILAKNVTNTQIKGDIAYSLQAYYTWLQEAFSVILQIKLIRYLQMMFKEINFRSTV